MRVAEVRSKKTEVRSHSKGIMPRIMVIGRMCLLVSLSSCFLLLASAVPAQDDVIKLVEAKRSELKERENVLKREEQRMIALRKELDEKTGSYTKLLAQVEASLKRVEQIKGEMIENVVKAYEGMPPGDAAARLAVLDEPTALQIMTRMKSKKSGAIIAIMEPQKAATLTRKMTTLTIKNRQQ